VSTLWKNNASVTIRIRFVINNIQDQTSYCHIKEHIIESNLMNIMSIKNSDIHLLQQDIKEHIVETNFMIVMCIINSYHRV
jgi:hypothetical protein